MPIQNRVVIDPQGQAFPAGLENDGPHLPIQISIPIALAQQLATSGAPVPSPHTGSALIDTGASRTCVDLQVIQALGLQPVNQISVATPSHASSQMSLYAVNISFPQTTIQLVAESIAVAGVTLANQGIVALLGRDFLANTVFIYNGPGGFFTISH